MSNTDFISETIMSMAARRGADKSICPSEVARALFETGWRRHMDEIRNAAIELQNAGKITITQKGRSVDTAHIKGPVRIRIV